jgi:hypothetical protein
MAKESSSGHKASPVEDVVERARWIPPNLKPDHLQRCSRCGRAHIPPLTDAEKSGQQDAVERLCALAQAVVNQDYVAQRDLPVGDTEQISDAQTGREATTGGGSRAAG